ncbi:MAG: TetR/AcrR family transcriptional regulator [Deltaproteobacteria bacterium]|nr:TetR/AcrR family transcriptional regulator [Deltaproteobacteria bacterium]
MGRSSKYSKEQIVTSAAELIAEGGVQAATMTAIAKRSGAPIGSLYHRYPSREALLAELWLDLIEQFQAGLTSTLDGDPPLEAAVATALYAVRWTREKPVESRVMLLFHRRELMQSDDLPGELAERAAKLEPQLGEMLRGFCRRYWGEVNSANMERARLAILGIPAESARSYLERGKTPPALVDAWVERACRAVLADD